MAQQALFSKWNDIFKNTMSVAVSVVWIYINKCQLSQWGALTPSPTPEIKVLVLATMDS